MFQTMFDRLLALFMCVILLVVLISGAFSLFSIRSAMIDSRMEIYREVLGATPLGGFSDRVFALDGKKLYHHE